MSLTAVILAAGKGTRMKSKLPKVLHKVNGRAMLDCVVSSVKNAGVQDIILIVGHEASKVQEHMGNSFLYAEQKEQLGTGHAIMMCADTLNNYEGDVLIVCGDTPLLTSETLQSLYQEHKKQAAAGTVLTAQLADSFGYGRIIRTSSGAVTKIVEEKDASEEEKAIKEINTGSYCFKIKDLLEAIQRLTPANAQGEYYLTDVIADFNKHDKTVAAYKTNNFEETLGINSKSQLAEASAILRMKKIEQLMQEGVTIIDPHSTYVEEGVSIAADSVVYPMCFLEGETVIGEDCIIGPGCQILNSKIGNSCEIQSSVIKEAKIADACSIGPFAYLRPGTVLGGKVKIGDFAEVKNSVIGEGSKIPHLSYVGDAVVGKGVNIGAGTITCNYDGVNKHKTRIQDGAFIGSNTNLVAPVDIGANAVTGAGSTITKDVPEGALAVERATQKIRLGYKNN